MNLQMTGHHLEVSPAMRSYVTDKLTRITRHFDHVIDVNVTCPSRSWNRRSKPPCM